MIKWVYCATCGELNNVDSDTEAQCVKCATPIRDVDYTMVNLDIFDFMTLGTDVRMPPRADNG